MQYIFYFLTIVLLGALSCRSIMIEDLHVSKNNHVIPISLTPQVDNLSLATAFWGLQGSSNMFSGLQLSLDYRMLDTRTIFERTMQQQFANHQQPQGFISLSIPFSDYGYGKGFGYIFANVFTACIPALCGLPIAISKVNIEIEVNIKTITGKNVATYTAQGIGKDYRALYWGYSKTAASRKITIQALEDALQKISLQIQKDSLKIVQGFQKN